MDYYFRESILTIMFSFINFSFNKFVFNQPSVVTIDRQIKFNHYDPSFKILQRTTKKFLVFLWNLVISTIPKL